MLEGIVQGVGFRPFVKNLADRLHLAGITFNTASGLIVEFEADTLVAAQQFLAAIRSDAPSGARIEASRIETLPEASSYDGFQIVASAPRDNRFTLTSPDLAICARCKEEIDNPADRRFQYPFTNCTNCGPRYSITLCTPYDRANTTMAPFQMCAACAEEYADPHNQRFHAEPIACPACGPRLSIDISAAIAALESGQILALKSLGGFQLACDAFQSVAVDELRVRKRRSRKPFAVMMRDLTTAEQLCLLADTDRNLLCGPAAPIVLLPMRNSASFPAGVAPGLTQIGVMLPYTPLHQLLFKSTLACLVMTSGNISEEPIVTLNKAAIDKLTPLSDCLLLHDRDIFMRVDDSVARIFEGVPRVLRRARGYAPGAISLGREVPEVLAVGAELKNAFCITKGRYALPSQHLGDLENSETLVFMQETLHNLQSVYQAEPRLIVHDLHPDYVSTRWALQRSEPKLAVQHHHAHIASCMAENGLNESVMGVAFDGTGYGADGQIWGGEFLICDYRGYRRMAHLRYVSQPGGDRAARQGWRMAAAHLYDALGEDFLNTNLPCWRAAPPASWKIIHQMLHKPAIQTSSCGRLFDAVAALCGIATESSYEGEAAMLLEEAARGETGSLYSFDLDTQAEPWIVDTRPMLREIVADTRLASVISATFHGTLACIIDEVCRRIRAVTGVNCVCLSGGTFQNFTLLASACQLLRSSGFELYLHSQVPPNDGGISLGQAAIGASFLQKQR